MGGSTSKSDDDKTCFTFIFFQFICSLKKICVKIIAFKLLLAFASGHIIVLSNCVCPGDYFVVVFFYFGKRFLYMVVIFVP